MHTTLDTTPAAPPRASGPDVLDTLAQGGSALLLDQRVAPPRAFVAVLAEHADGQPPAACAEPVLVSSGADLPLPDFVADAAIQLARLAGGCGEASLAQVENYHELPDLPAITVGGVGCLVDDDTRPPAVG